MEDFNFEVEPHNQYYTLLDTENRITMATAIQQNDEQFLFDYPTGFDFGAIHDYKIVDGELVHEPVIYPEPEPQPTGTEKLKADVDYIATITGIEL